MKSWGWIEMVESRDLLVSYCYFYLSARIRGTKMAMETWSSFFFFLVFLGNRASTGKDKPHGNTLFSYYSLVFRHTAAACKSVLSGNRKDPTPSGLFLEGRDHKWNYSHRATRK